MRVALLGFAALVATTGLAWAEAETCKADPEPAVMSMRDFEKLELQAAKTASTDLFKDIKLYQEASKTYRDCLDRQIKVIEDKGKDATDSEKSSKSKMSEAYNKSIDSEETLAKTFNAMLDSLCARGDKESCPP